VISNLNPVTTTTAVLILSAFLLPYFPDLFQVWPVPPPKRGPVSIIATGFYRLDALPVTRTNSVKALKGNFKLKFVW